MKLLPSRRHLVWIIPLFILIVVILTLLLVAIDARKRFNQQAVIPVSPDMRMRLVAAMTTKNPEYNPDPEFWRKTKQFIIDKAPASVRPRLPISVFPSVTLSNNVTSQGVQLVFELDRSAALRKLPYQDINAYLRDHDIHQLRLQYGPHSYSRAEKPSGWLMELRPGVSVAYTAVIYPSVPANLKTLTLQVLTDDEVTHEVELPNPVYRPTAAQETSASLETTPTLSPETTTTTSSSKETP